MDLDAILLPYLWLKVRETIWSQIKTNLLMAYLFAQKINPFQQCTICSITCGLLFLKEKWTQASPVSLWGPTVEADSLRSERKEPSSSPICCRSPRGDKQCWFWHSLPVPTNKSCLFSPKHVGSGSCWGTGNEEQDEGKQEREKTALGLEKYIVCMCTEAQGLWPAA